MAVGDKQRFQGRFTGAIEVAPGEVPAIKYRGTNVWDEFVIGTPVGHTMAKQAVSPSAAYTRAGNLRKQYGAIATFAARTIDGVGWVYCTRTSEGN
jgi:hypothetical protein